MSKQTCFNSIAMKADGRGEVLIYDTIGEDFWTGEGVTAKGIDAALKSLGSVSDIDLRINSNGGDVFQGNAIYAALNAHPAKVHVHIDGIAASMASLIAMVGDTVSMSENALFMIHEPRGVARGTSEDMLATASLLDAISANAVNVYAGRTKQDPAALKSAMVKETWYTASQAKAAGFVDTITPNKHITAHFDVSQFANAPEWAQAQLKQFSSLNQKGQAMPDTKEPEKKEAIADQVDVAAITAKATADANAAAHERVTTIIAMCNQAGFANLAASYTADPKMSIEDVRGKLFDAMCKKNKPIGDEGSSDQGQSPDDPNAKYKAEFAENPLYAKSMTVDQYVAMRRIDDGADSLIKSK